jgi:uncharacterized protein (DUF111 family)
LPQVAFDDPSISGTSGENSFAVLIDAGADMKKTEKSLTLYL